MRITNLHYIFSTLLCALCFLQAKADTISDIEEMLSLGEASNALQLAKIKIAESPKSSNILGKLNNLAGQAAYTLGDNEEAKKHFAIAKTKGIHEANLWLARIALSDYRFKDASSLFSEYETYFKKNKIAPPESLKKEIEMAEVGCNYLTRVESIIVIDSIPAKKEDFFRLYKLPSSAGQLLDESHLPTTLKAQIPKDAIWPAYCNENSDLILFSAPYNNDSIESSNYVIWQADLLGNGEWHVEPHPELSEGYDAITPFMLSDGQTLYFAGNSDSSLGDYDIMISSRDITTGKYRAAQNIGMPYNSMGKDFLLAIDEENNVGWWASSRNANKGDDDLTIYLFIPNETRKNINDDDDNLINLAKLTNFKATWPQDADYTNLLQSIKKITPQKKRKEDFSFAISGRGVLHYWDELRSREGKDALKEFLNAQKQFNTAYQHLQQLRKVYHNGNTAVAKQIKELEKNIDSYRNDMQKKANKIYRYEADY